MNDAKLKNDGLRRLPEGAFLKFYLFVSNEIDAKDFKKWICSAEDLESVIGKTTYFDLLSFDYSNKRAVAELGASLTRLIEVHNPGELAKEQAKRVLRGMLDGHINMAIGCRKLSALWNQKNEWIPVIFCQLRKRVGRSARSRPI